MTPELLRAFLTVSRHRNFTHAATELSVSQPAMSRQIQMLERELGVRLFERLGKAVHLTAAGETLAHESEALLGDLDRLLEHVRAHAAPGVGRLRIGAGTTPGLYMVPRVLGEFRRRFPKVDLTYCIGPSDQIARKVQSNELDIGFVGKAVEVNTIVCEPIADDEIVCFAALRHPATRRKRIDFRSIVNETWLVRPSGSATRALFDTWRAQFDADPQNTIELSCPEGIRELVAFGVGLSYMSIHGIQADVRHRRLAILNIKGMPLRRLIHTIRHIDKRLDPPAQAFHALFKEHCAIS